MSTYPLAKSRNEECVANKTNQIESAQGCKGPYQMKESNSKLKIF